VFDKYFEKHMLKETKKNLQFHNFYRFENILIYKNSEFIEPVDFNNL